jgi:hypothetical protein
MSESQTEEVRQRLSSVLTDRKMPGISVASVTFDFYTSSYRVTFRWESKTTQIALSSERVADVVANTFSLRRLRNELRLAFNVDQED